MANSPTKGTTAGNNRLGLPNNQELEQMTNEELDNVLQQCRTAYVTVKGKMSQGLTPPGGNMRQLRVTIARCLTIQGKRGRAA